MPLTHAVQQNCCKVKVGESQIRGHPGPKKALDGKNGLPGITTTPGTIRTACGGAPIACTAHVPHLGVRKLSASCSCLFRATAEIVNCLEKNRLQPVREPETEPGRERCCVKPPKTSQQIKNNNKTLSLHWLQTWGYIYSWKCPMPHAGSYRGARLRYRRADTTAPSPTG